MKTNDPKRESFEHLFQNRYQVLLADFLHACHDFKLGLFIHCIDVIDTFLLVQVTLVYRVNANVDALARVF